jgi:hypothetical protein
MAKSPRHLDHIGLFRGKREVTQHVRIGSAREGAAGFGERQAARGRIEGEQAQRAQGREQDQGGALSEANIILQLREGARTTAELLEHIEMMRRGEQEAGLVGRAQGAQRGRGIGWIHGVRGAGLSG